jgi:RNA polymerase subunit RPABC4/transcription elongation factor Spt4
MSETAKKIFNNIVINDKEKSVIAFGKGIKEKLDDALEVRKVGLTAKIYNTADTTK